MKYTYIKQRHGKSEETKIRFTSDSDERATHMETEIVSEEGAAPEFIEAMKALRSDFLTLLELPAEYAEGLEIHTLSFRHSSKNDRWGVVITGSKTLDTTGRPFNISTPLFNQPADSEGYGKKGVLGRDLEQKILAVIKHADAFRKGERSQQELDLENSQVRTGRGKGPDPTPIEAAAQGAGEEAEPEEKSFRAGEIPEEDASDSSTANEEANQEAPAAETPKTPFDDDDDLPWEEEEEEADCSYPGCRLQDGHDGSHEVYQEEEEAAADAEPTEDQADTTETKLVDLDVNPTLLSVLKRAEITTVEELAARREGLEDVKGIGPTSLNIVDAILEEHAGGAGAEVEAEAAPMPV